MIFAVCFLTSALVGAGVGGGGLLTLYLTLTGSAAQLAAQEANLISFVFAASPSAVVCFREYRPDLRLVTFLSFCAAVGCIFGSLAAPSVPDPVLRKIYGVFMITSALAVLSESRSSGVS